jgi:hypothetical protein
VAQERQTAKAIFSGKVTRIAETADSKYIQITFKVEQSWKGAPSREKSLIRENVLTDCDFGFEVGDEYLVYAHGDPEKLSTDTCTRTKRLVDATMDIKELGAPEHARPGSSRTTHNKSLHASRVSELLIESFRLSQLRAAA